MIVNDPQRRAERARNFREILDLSYGLFFKACNLTPEQIEKVKDLQVWHDQSVMELDAVAEAEGLLIRGPEYMKLKGALEGTRRRKVAELFDPLGLTARFSDFERLGLLRDTVQRIGSIGALRPRVVYGWTSDDWAAINWDKAAPQLQTVLSPAQYAALRQYMRTKKTWTAVMEPWGQSRPKREGSAGCRASEPVSVAAQPFRRRGFHRRDSESTGARFGFLCVLCVSVVKRA